MLYYLRINFQSGFGISSRAFVMLVPSGGLPGGFLLSRHTLHSPTNRLAAFQASFLTLAALLAPFKTCSGASELRSFGLSRLPRPTIQAMPQSWRPYRPIFPSRMAFWRPYRPIFLSRTPFQRPHRPIFPSRTTFRRPYRPIFPSRTTFRRPYRPIFPSRTAFWRPSRSIRPSRTTVWLLQADLSVQDHFPLSTDFRAVVVLI